MEAGLTTTAAVATATGRRRRRGNGKGKGNGKAKGRDGLPGPSAAVPLERLVGEGLVGADRGGR